MTEKAKIKIENDGENITWKVSGDKRTYAHRTACEMISIYSETISHNEVEPKAHYRQSVSLPEPKIIYMWEISELLVIHGIIYVPAIKDSVVINGKIFEVKDREWNPVTTEYRVYLDVKD